MNQEKTEQTDPLKQNTDYQPSQEIGNPPQDPLESFGGPQFNPSPVSQRRGLRRWINKYGSSVILPIIALLILAGGIYLYATQKQETPENLAGLSPALQENQETAETIPEATDKQAQANLEKKGNEVEEIVPASRQENNQIIEKAAQGDGITHLARRALKTYLADHNQEGLTNEHKIYIEDYLKDQIGSRPLAVGEEISFSEDQIKAAIDASLQLTDNQLKNLEKYSALVVSW